MTHVSEIQVTYDVAVKPWVTTRLFRCEECPKEDPKVVIEIPPVAGAFEGVPAARITGCRKLKAPDKADS